jgi:hypothetical protein
MMNRDIQYKSAWQGTISKEQKPDNIIITWGVSENPNNTISINGKHNFIN